jgi:hypothetical protein
MRHPQTRKDPTHLSYYYYVDWTHVAWRGMLFFWSGYLSKSSPTEILHMPRERNVDWCERHSTCSAVKIEKDQSIVQVSLKVDAKMQDSLTFPRFWVMSLSTIASYPGKEKRNARPTVLLPQVPTLDGHCPPTGTAIDGCSACWRCQLKTIEYIEFRYPSTTL